MKRDFLEGLDLGNGAKLPKNIIDTIMTENGKDINTAKGDLSTITAERDSLREQLTTVQSSLDQFKGINVEELNAKITQLQNDLTAKDTEYQAKLDGMAFDSLVAEKISGLKGKNAKAISALLDLDTLRGSKNQGADIEAALNTLKTENPYLFDAADNNGSTTVSTGGSHSEGGTPDSTNATMNALFRGSVAN